MSTRDEARPKDTRRHGHASGALTPPGTERSDAMHAAQPPPRHGGHRGSEGPRRRPKVTQLVVARLDWEPTPKPPRGPSPLVTVGWLVTPTHFICTKPAPQAERARGSRDKHDRGGTTTGTVSKRHSGSGTAETEEPPACEGRMESPRGLKAGAPETLAVEQDGARRAEHAGRGHRQQQQVGRGLQGLREWVGLHFTQTREGAGWSSPPSNGHCKDPEPSGGVSRADAHAGRGPVSVFNA